MDTLLAKLRALFRRRHLEAEMAEEMRQHLERRTQEKMAEGLSPEEARYAAQREFGGVAQVQEQCRDERRLVWLEQGLQDLRYAARSLRKTPGFAMISVFTFAVGIGAALAIVSVADVFYLRPLPLQDPGRVVTLWQANRAAGTRGEDVASGNAVEWLARARSFEGMAVAEPWTLRYSLPDRPSELLAAARVSENFFGTLGTPLLHGRPFLPADHLRGAPRAVILSHAFWQERFGGNPAVVGTPVRLDDGAFYLVAGVLPPSFELRLFDRRDRLPEPLLWLPKSPFDEAERAQRGGRGYHNVIGRLAPGVTLAHAQAELDAISAQLAREYPQTNASISAEVLPLREHLLGRLRDMLPLLVGAAVILLIVACANVANLLLARGAGREREFAVRHALGASRGRLVRQIFAESLLLAVAGGAGALLLARATLDLIARLRPLDVARVDHIPIDARAAVIACGMSLVAAVVAGLAPSLQFSRRAVATTLKDARGSARSRVRSALIVFEVAAAVVLAVGAGLLVRSFVLIQSVDPGFKPDDVAVLQTFLFERFNTSQKRVAFVDQVLSRMQALPGTVAAGAVSSMPFGDAKVVRQSSLDIAGRPAVAGDGAQVYATAVAGDYFRAMRVPLIAGRLFDATDTGASRQVVLVSRTAAQKFWPGGDPLGARVRFQFGGEPFDAEVVGVVGEVRHDGLDLPPRAELFLPHAQSGFGVMAFVVRLPSAASGPFSVLKEQIWALDPLQPVNSAYTLERLMSRTLVGRRFNLVLLGGFAGVTLLLAIVGVYGVMNFSTSQRTRELGVRVALGATPRGVLLLVLRQGLKLIALGLGIGLAVAFALSRSVESLLFGVSGQDPLTFTAIVVLLGGAGAAACFIPARRATKVDPVIALRAE